MANLVNYTIGFKADESGLLKVKAALQDIQKKAQIQTVGLNQQDLLNAADAAKQLENALTKAYNVRLGTTNVATFNQELQKTGKTLDKYREELSWAGKEGNKAFNQLASSLINTNLQLKQSNQLLTNMATTMSNTIKWGIASSAMNTFSGNIQHAYGYVKNLDRSLNNIRIVTGKSAEDMRTFGREANIAAKALGTATLEYTEASLIYYQQGLSDEQVQARANVTAKAANVAQTSAEEMSEYLTAVWNGYKVDAAEAELYVDKLSKVAATTASDLEELATGMSKVASVAASMGVDIDQLNAQLATIISVTRQAPESAGVALKTIFARIYDLSLGATDEDNIDFGAVNDELNKMGISITDETESLKDMGEVIEEIGEKWGTWTKEQQTAIAVAIAGKRQYNNLFALFDNWDMYTASVRESATAVGTLQEQQDIYMESAAAGLNRLSTSWEKIFASLLDGRTINRFANSLEKVVNSLSDFIDGIGGGANFAISAITALSVLFSNQLAKGISDARNQLVSFYDTAKQQTAVEDTIRQINAMYGSASLSQASQLPADKVDTASRDALLAQSQAAKELLSVRRNLTDEELKSAQISIAKIGTLTQEVAEIEQYNAMVKERRATLTEEEGTEKERLATLTLVRDKIKEISDAIREEVELSRATTASNKERREDSKVIAKEQTERLIHLYGEHDILEAINEEYDLSLSIVKNLAGDKRQITELNKLLLQTTMALNTEEGKIREEAEIRKLVEKGTGDELKLQLEQEKQRLSYLKEEGTQRQNISMLIKGISATASVINAVLSFSNTLLDKNATSAEKWSAASSSLSSALSTVGMALMVVNPVIGSIVSAIGVIGGGILRNISKEVADAAKRSEELNNQWKNLGNEIKSVNDKILTLSSDLKEVKLDTELSEEFKELSNGVSQYGENISLTSSEYKRYLELVVQLVGYSDQIVVGYNTEGQAIIDKNTALEETVRLLKEERIEQQKAGISRESQAAVIQAIEEAMKNSNDALKKSGKELSSIALQYQVIMEGFIAEVPDVLKVSFDYEGAFEDLARIAEIGRLAGDNSDYIVENLEEIKEVYKRLRTGITDEASETVKTFIRTLDPSTMDAAVKDYDRALKQNAKVMESASRDFVKLAFDIGMYTDDMYQQLENTGFANAFSKYIISAYNITDNASFQAQKHEVMDELEEFIANIPKLTTEQIKIFDESQYKNRQEYIGALLDFFKLEEYAEEELTAIEIALDVKFNPDEDSIITGTTELMNDVQRRFDESVAKKGLNLNINLSQYFTSTEAQKALSLFDFEALAKDAEKEIQRVKELLMLQKERVQDYELVSSSLKALLSGEELEAKTIEKLIDLYKDLGLTRGSTTAEWIDVLKTAQEELEKTAIKAAKLESVQKIEAAQEILVKAKLDDDELIDALSAVVDAEYDIYVNVEIDRLSDFNDMVTVMEEVETMASKIGEKFIVAAEDISKLNEVFPGILEGMQILEDGSVKLNRTMVENAMSSAQSEVEIEREKVIEKLRTAQSEVLARAEAAKVLAEMAQQVATGEINSADFSSEQRSTIDAALQTLKTENSEETSKKEQDDQKNVVDSSAINAKRLATNYGNAFAAIVTDSANAFNQVIANGEAAATGGTVSSAFKSVASGVETTGGAELQGITKANIISELDTKGIVDDNAAYLSEALNDYYTALMAQYNAFEGNIAEIEARGVGLDKVFDNISKGIGAAGKKASGSSKEVKDLTDIYHDLNIELQKLEKNLERVQKVEEHMVGQDLLDNLAQQTAYYREQNRLLEEKLALQRTDLAQRRAELEGMGVTFGEEGQILDYNKFVNVEGLRDKMSEYETLLYESVETTKDSIQEVYDALYDIEVKKFTYHVEIAIDIDDARKAWKEFLDEMANYAEDNIIDPLQSNIDLFEQLTASGSSVEYLTEQINKTIAELEKGEGGLFAGREAEGLAMLEEYQNKLQSALLDINSLQKEIEAAYLNFIDKAKNEFDEHVDQYQRISDILDHQATLVELIYGEHAYDLLNQVFDAQYANNLGQLDFYRQQIDYWTELRDTFDEGTDEWKAANKNIEETQTNLNKLIEQSIKNLVSQYENAVAAIFDAVDRSLTGGLGLSAVGEQWEQVLYLQDKYLDNTDRIIQTQKLSNTMQADINAASNLATQQKLRDVQEQILGQLRERDKLTQYDLDRAEALYKIALAEVALQDAQQAKTSMRLVRDTQGNWTYQYTADQGAIDQAQQDLLNAQSSLYYMDVNAYQSNLQEMYDIYAEYQEKVKALYSNTTIDAEEKERLKVEYAQYYGTLIDEITAQNQEIRVNLTSSAFATIAAIYAQDQENVTGLTEAELALIQDMTAGFELSYLEFEESVRENWDNISEKSDETMGSILGMWTSSVQEMISRFAEDEDSFMNVCLNTYDQLDEATADYQTKLKELEEAAGNNFTNISSNIADAAEQTGILNKVVGDLILKYEEEWEAINDLFDQYKTLVGWYDSVKEAALAAAQAAYELAQANRQAALNAEYSDISYSTGYISSSGTGTGGTSGTGKGTGGTSGAGVSGTSGGGASAPVTNYRRTYKPISYMTDEPIVKGYEKITLTSDSNADDLKRVKQDTAFTKQVNEAVNRTWGPDDPVTMGGWQLKLITSVRAAKGGVVTDTANSLGEDTLAAVKYGERILTTEQTKTFDNFIYDILPAMINALKEAKNMHQYINNTSISNVDSINSPAGGTYYIDRLEFPNVSSSDEIRSALINLSGYASQRVNSNRT